MTRSFGDLIAKSVGVSAEPEIQEFKIQPNNQGHFIVVASDGLWDRISNEEVASIVGNNFYEKNDAEGAANLLMKESVERWQKDQGMIDDITIIVIFMAHSTQSN